MSKFFNRDFFYYISLFTQLGMTMIANILGALLLYSVFAKYVFRHPILLFLFLFLGIVSGYYQVYQMIFRKKGRKEKDGRHKDRF